jgi:hypothetical protein
MRRRSVRLLFVCMAAGVPILTWVVRAARGGKHKKRGAAIRDNCTPDSTEDFTPEQTAFLGRVREIWDEATAGQVSPQV